MKKYPDLYEEKDKDPVDLSGLEQQSNSNTSDNAQTSKDSDQSAAAKSS